MKTEEEAKDEDEVEPKEAKMDSGSTLPRARRRRKGAPLRYVADFDRKQTFINLPVHKSSSISVPLFGVVTREGFARLYMNPCLSDVTLVLGDERVPAHKIVLRIWSDTFRVMLDAAGPWKEKSMDELVVDVEPDAYDCFKLMLRYMYTGDSNFITGHNVIALMELANYYGVHPLKELCGELLGRTINADNLDVLLGLSEHLSVEALETACSDYVAESFTDVLESEELLEFRPSLCAKVLRSDSLRTRSEQQVLQAALRYANQFMEEPTKRDKDLGDIQHISCVSALLDEAIRFKLHPDSVPIDCPRIKPRWGFRFDPDRCPDNFVLSEENMRVTARPSRSWKSIRCMEPFRRHQNYIEFKVLDRGYCMLGIAAGPIPMTGSAAQYRNGWAYSSRGEFCHNNIHSHTGRSYTIGDRIGVGVDYRNRTFVFYKNDLLVMTLTDVPSTDLYPIVSLHAASEGVSIVADPGRMSEKKEFSKYVKAIPTTTGNSSWEPDFMMKLFYMLGLCFSLFVILLVTLGI